MTELRKLAEEAAKLLQQASEDIEDWGSYASDYFQEKHDLLGDIKKYSDKSKELLTLIGKEQQR